MKLSRKIKRIEPKIVALLDGTRSLSEISELTKASYGTIKTIATHHNLVYTKQKSKFIGRDEKIKELCKDENITYIEIGKIFNLSPTSVGRIAKRNNIIRNTYKSEDYVKLAIKIRKDMNSGMTYNQIVEKYKFTNTEKGALIRYAGLKLFTEFKEKRDKEIAKRYMSGKAGEILNSDEQILNNPRQIRTLSQIYVISSENGVKKYPKIGSRTHGGIFLPKRVINFIKNKKDKEKLSFTKIAEFLNKKKFITVTGKKFTNHNVRFKYLYIKKHGL